MYSAVLVACNEIAVFMIFLIYVYMCVYKFFEATQKKEIENK